MGFVYDYMVIIDVKSMLEFELFQLTKAHDKEKVRVASDKVSVVLVLEG